MPASASHDLADASRRLRDLPVPAYEVKAALSYTGEQYARARDGRFTVFGIDVELRPPVDWAPPGPLSLQGQLHAWRFMDPLLQLAAAERDAGAYELALALALDWIGRNPLGAAGLPKYAWTDKVCADRSTYLGYLARLGGARGWLEDEDAETLVGAIVAHGRWLADPGNYRAPSNHRLWQDLGLAQLSRYASGFLDEAGAWREVALGRFARTLAALVEEREGMYLEHSVSYHLNALEMLRSATRRGLLDGRALEPLIERMAQTAGWLVQPDGRLSQIGDTHREDAAELGVAPGGQGLRFMPRAGWAVVRHADSYLITSAAYAGKAHKHADELSFELFDRGRRIVADSGKYAYGETDPFRRYVRSAEAHNVVIVDGHGGVWWRRRPPYGSGMLAAGEGDGWYAILATNPLVEPHGVQHERLLAYRPGRALLVVDTLSSPTEREYVRLFHLDPAIQASPGRVTTLRAEGFAGSVEDARGCAPAIVRGQSEPLQGWTSPHERARIPAATLAFATRASSTTEVTAFGLGTQVRVRRLDPGPAIRATVSIGRRRHRLEIVRDGEALRVRSRRLLP